MGQVIIETSWISDNYIRIRWREIRVFVEN